MHYRLRTLVLLTAVGPPLLAWAYWTAQWIGAHPAVFIVFAMASSVAMWVIGPVAWYYELVNMVCGPNPFRPSRRKKRRPVRVRMERYLAGST